VFRLHVVLWLIGAVSLNGCRSALPGEPVAVRGQDISVAECLRPVGGPAEGGGGREPPANSGQPVNDATCPGAPTTSEAVSRRVAAPARTWQERHPILHSVVKTVEYTAAAVAAFAILALLWYANSLSESEDSSAGE
jgi:hypothetical protein